jgi:hypothetical protein
LFSASSTRCIQTSAGCSPQGLYIIQRFYMYLMCEILRLYSHPNTGSWWSQGVVVVMAIGCHCLLFMMEKVIDDGSIQCWLNDSRKVMTHLLCWFDRVLYRFLSNFIDMYFAVGCSHKH